ncbi:hypothetical protein Tco_1475736 [Tanacetum coccineum]
MINKTSKHKVFLKLRIPCVISAMVDKKWGFGYLKEIVVKRADQKHYTFKEGVESYQQKLKLLKPQRTCPGITSKELYTPNYDPRGVIYEDKKKQKRLMQLDELYKFSNGTLQSVYKTFHTRLQNVNLRFNLKSDMPNRAWTKKDQERIETILKKIDVVLLKRRIMRSLEVLVGGRKTETDK